MVNLAIAGEPLFQADRRELERQGNSYTFDTLRSLRDDLGAEIPLAFVLGMDAFLAFRSWHRWQEIMQLAHLVVMSRPGYLPDLHDWYGELLAQTTCELRSTAARRVTFLSVTPLEISATKIREACKNNKSVRFLVPDDVYQYIERYRLYS